MATFFLRFTNTANEDLERGTSIHASDLSISHFTAEQASESFGCDIDSVGVFNEHYCQVLNGLCGYLLDAETLDEAIEEVEDNNYQFEDAGSAVIFTGRYSSDAEFVPDGDLFIPYSIAKML